MKPDIHPKYEVTQVACVCGNTFTTRSTKSDIKVEICSACHPFFTGKQKMLDTAGRVERFQKRFASTGGKMIVRKPKVSVAAKVAKAPKSKTLTTAPRQTAAKAKAAKAAKKAEKKS